MKLRSGRVIAAALFAAVLLAHYAGPYIKGAAGIGQAGWGYIGQHVLIVVLAAALVPLLLNLTRTLDRDVALAAAVVAMLESIQPPPCRLLIGPHLASVPAGVNLCDHVTGWPITSVMYGVELLVVVAIVFAKRRRRPQSEPTP